MNKITRLAFLSMMPFCFGGLVVHGDNISWISSTSDKPWHQMTDLSFYEAEPDAPTEVHIAPNRTYQTIDGFGGCFNELGWVALQKATEADRNQVIKALFGEDGCAFKLARLPIGSSDFGLDAYSLADTPDDYELKHFTIRRDMKHLIPYVKAAMKVQPDLKCWASPWSPPAWMKTNNSYSRGSLKWEERILQSYAQYFVRWIESYQAEGIYIYAISPQNEPNILNVYPTCEWTGSQLREFIGEHLGPTLSESNTNVELWLGLNGDPPNGGDNVNGRLLTVLEDKTANSYLTGIGFQYDSKMQICAANQLYPDKKLMQTETVCHNGDNTWGNAEQLFALMKRFFDCGANAYFLWNMVLDDTGMSTWKWRQNAPITVDRETGKVTYNGEYYVMRHFSQFVKTGAKRVLTTGMWGDKIAFVNPDGTKVLVMGNSLNQPHKVAISVDLDTNKNTLTATLSAHSINTFVIDGEAAR